MFAERFSGRFERMQTSGFSLGHKSVNSQERLKHFNESSIKLHVSLMNKLLDKVDASFINDRTSPLECCESFLLNKFGKG